MSKRTSEQAGLDKLSKDTGTVSEVFNSENADIELLSESGKRYLVHKSNLSSGSTFFSDMISIASSNSTSNNSIGTRSSTSKREVLQMEETSKVLDIILPYFYPVRIEPWDSNLVTNWKTFAAFEKYGIWRGIEAMEVYLRNFIEKESSERSSLGWFNTYLFFSHLDVPDKKEILKEIRLHLLESLGTEPNQVRRLKNIREMKIPNFMIDSIDVNALLFWIQSRTTAITEAYRDHTIFLLRKDIRPPFFEWAKVALCYTERSLQIRDRELTNPNCVHVREQIVELRICIASQEAGDEGPV